MKKREDEMIPFPLPYWGFENAVTGLSSLDPLGSYTGRMPERFEDPVQDADDL